MMDLKPYWRFIWMTVVGAIALISGLFSVVREIIGIYSGNSAGSAFWPWAGIAFVASAATLYVTEHRSRVAAERKLQYLAQDRQAQKEVRARFARLMEEGKSLDVTIVMAQNSGEIHSFLSVRQEWKERVMAALKAADMEIDSVAFSHAADNPSKAVVGTFTHIPATKELYWIELEMHRRKLQEIVERNKL